MGQFTPFLPALALIFAAPAMATSPTPAGKATTDARRTITWTDMRDAGVVKQKFDYSCGAASLATLLRYYYGHAVDEADVLRQIAAAGPATFASLAEAAGHFGYEARGYALSLDALRRIALPVIVFLYVGEDDHFSVLRSIDSEHVELADPSLGNRIYAIPDFLRLWTTRPSRDYPGRALIVLPHSSQTVGNSAFMRPIPSRFGGLRMRPFQP